MDLKINKVYSITQYKNGTHRMFTTIKVKSKKGKTIEVYKKDVTTYSGIKSSRGGSIFHLNNITLSTKTGVVKYLKEK